MRINTEDIVLGAFALFTAVAAGLSAHQRLTETPKEKKARLKREAAWAERKQELAAKREAKREERRETQRVNARKYLDSNRPLLDVILTGDTSDYFCQRIIAETGDLDKLSFYRACKADGVEFSAVQKNEIRKSFKGVAYGIV